MRARDVIGPGSPLSRSLKGYEDRPGQLAMAEAIEDALEAEKSLFVEAGTGTGKTLAYLVPAILSGKKVVISTATRALQEQIFSKDLPLVSEVLGAHGVHFRASLMKGLSNYLCKRRFGELFVDDGEGERTRTHGRISFWARTTRTGDRAELYDLPEDAPVWRDVQSSPETRIGSGCEHFDACFVTRMRRDAEDAQVIVVNHHLFFADLALRASKSGDYASAIPNYDAVVFDEAHQIEDIATDFFGSRVSSARVDALTRDARRTFVAAKVHGTSQASPGRGQYLRESDAILDQTSHAAATFFQELAHSARLQQGETRRTLTERDWTPGVLTAYGKLDACLEVLAGKASASGREEALALVARRADDLRADLRGIVRGSRTEEHAPSRVAWLNFGDRTVSIGASPIELGTTLRASLFDRIPSVICTSATLATSGGATPSFHFARSRLGAPPATRELVVDSPFDFASRAALYLPRDLPEPNDPAYEDAAIERILELTEITLGGAFVLCTSNRVMKRFHGLLSKRTSLPVLVQGEGPKHVLLERFREAKDAVLVATMSFWEGVDVPGRALRLVILDKIPFAVPTDPIVAARSLELERQGGNPFSQYAVPTAAITLKQGFGRLLRTQKDAGIVAILDRRIVTKGYGRMLVTSLPPARLISDLDDLKAFWREIAW